MPDDPVDDGQEEKPKLKVKEPVLFRGKTYQEWVDDALAAANYDPLEFVGKDEKAIREILDRNQGLYMALLEIDSLFGVKDARKAMYAIASKRYTQQAKLQLRMPAPNGGHAQLGLEDGQRGEVNTFLDSLLRGDKKLPGSLVPAEVTSADIRRFTKPRFTE